MSDAPITLLACPVEASKPQAAFDWFPTSLSSFRSVVIVAAKVQPPAGIKKINIASDYPAELARIESLAAITGAYDCGLMAAPASMVLFGLSRLLELHPETVRVALLCEKMMADPACLEPAFAAQDRPFQQLAHDPAVILFDRSQYRADLALSLALETVLSGAIYALGETTSLVGLIEKAQEIAKSAPMEHLAAGEARTAISGVEVY